MTPTGLYRFFRARLAEERYANCAKSCNGVGATAPHAKETVFGRAAMHNVRDRSDQQGYGARHSAQTVKHRGRITADAPSRQEECAYMPGKMARSRNRVSFRDR